MEFKCFILMLWLETSFAITVSRKTAVNESLSQRQSSLVQKAHIVRTIKSEDGDIIDCINMYKQPALNHPALRDHKIQLNPNQNPKREGEKAWTDKNGDSTETTSKIAQIWHKSGSCPKGTIPIRRMKRTKNLPEEHSHNRKQPMFLRFEKQWNESKELYLLQNNHSLAILHAEVFGYQGGKADIKVWNPKVERDDEYSTSRIALQNGPAHTYQSVESGWIVNPKVYGDRQTRVYVYWTADGSNQTGCFDLTCPGFVQTSNEIALGAAIYPISDPITIYIHKDPWTSNWWVQYQETVNIGYWPGELFEMLRGNAETIQYGGEVFSPRVGDVRPHTATAMGSGRFSDFIFATSGCITRMRVLRNNGELVQPQWALPYTDEFRCYDVFYARDYVEEPEFYFGGPGRNPLCP